MHILNYGPDVLASSCGLPLFHYSLIVLHTYQVGRPGAKEARRRGGREGKETRPAGSSLVVGFTPLFIMLKFILMVNKQGQTRLSTYYEWLTIPERVALEVSC